MGSTIKYSLLRFTCDKGQRTWNESHTEQEVIDIIRGTNETNISSSIEYYNLQKRIATFYDGILYIVVIYGRARARKELGVVSNREMRTFLNKYRTNSTSTSIKYVIAINTIRNKVIDILPNDGFYKRYWCSSSHNFLDGS